LGEEVAKKVMPSLREKKRYLAFEIISSGHMPKSAVASAIKRSVISYLGILESGRSGLMFLGECYDEASNRGILKVSNRHLDSVRAALALIKDIEGQKVIVRSLFASGIIAKAKEVIKCNP
jgi:ribonuclease P/MRP protein subunit POP5